MKNRNGENILKKDYMEYSLEELENSFWPEPEYNSSLVINCHRLRKVPLKDLNTEDLRMLIGQKIGLKYLIPLALELLEENYFCSGDFYSGDLLSALLRVDNDYWDKNDGLFYRLSDIMNTLEEYYNTYLVSLLPKWKEISK